MPRHRRHTVCDRSVAGAFPVMGHVLYRWSKGGIIPPLARKIREYVRFRVQVLQSGAVDRKERSCETSPMKSIKPIHTEDDYRAAIARVDELWESAPGTPEGDELEVLAVLIGSYEEDRNRPASAEAGSLGIITYFMEQRGL